MSRRAAEVRISMAEVGHAEQNAYAERVIRTIKEEEVYLKAVISPHPISVSCGNRVRPTSCISGAAQDISQS